MAPRVAPPPPEETAEDREAKRAEYFAALPFALSDAEEGLRSALSEVAANLGNVRLSLVASNAKVKDAKAAVDLPKFVGLSQWIQHRLRDEFTLVFDKEVKEPVLVAGPADSSMATDAAAASAEADLAIEEFYASLPADEFIPEELILRDAMIAALSQTGGSAKLSALTRGRQGSELHAARIAVLPKGAPLLGWLERRMGSEIRVSQDMHGSNIAELIGEAKKSAVKGAGKGKSDGKDKGAKGGDKGNGKGSAADRKVFRPSTVMEDSALTDEDRERQREESKVAREQRMTEFLDSLPSDRLTPEEQRLRQELLKGLENVGGGPVRLSVICQGADASYAKRKCLPSEMNIGVWIENRIGGEIILDRDSTGQSSAALASNHRRTPTDMPMESSSERASPEEREAAMVDYFNRAGPLQPQERKLRDCLVEACRRAGVAQRLSDVVNNDGFTKAAWQEAKATWARMRPPLEVSLTRWVELRLMEEVRVVREPFIQLVDSRKRKGGPMPPTGGAYSAQPAAKAPRVNGAARTGGAIGARSW